MANGMIGAAPEELRELAKVMDSSGATLKSLSSSLHSVISRARWNGPDSERFRSQWNNGMRMTLRSTGDSLAQLSKLVVAQATEQERTSNDSGPSGTPGGGAEPGGNGSPNSQLSGVVDANGNPIYQWGNLLASAGGFAADNLLAKMVNGGLLQKASWTLLGSRAGQLGSYVKGTQLLNGLSMLGRAAGVLSVVGGGAQFADGLINGDTNKMIDGGVTTVLAVGAFVPVVGPAFVAAGIAWAGMGLAANAMGFDSTSEMVGAGAKWVGNTVSDGANWIGDKTANVAKKAWGWLGGG